MLLSSIFAALVVGFFAYRTGTSSLRDESYERLTELRQERTRAIQGFIARTKSSAVINSQGLAIPAVKQFDAAYDELRDARITPEQQERLETYYAEVFAPRLQEFSTGTIGPESFVPTSPARSYLQAEYTTRSDDFDEKLAVDDAGDGSEWSRVNAEFQPFFREVVSGSGADDIMLLNTEGDIVWTAFKGVDLGSNIKRGEYRGGGLEQVFDEALRSNSQDYVAISDLELYQPSYNSAAGFVASPITDRNDEVIGVYVVQISISGIDAVMTGGPDPDVVTGLGDTGETYLVGPDGLMRSNSRHLIEDPEEYEADVIGQGTSRRLVDQALATGSSVMLQPASSAMQELAATGKSGTQLTTDYLGHEVLASYGPAGIDGLDWVVIAKMESGEAFAPVRDYARSVLLSTAAVVLLVSAASVLAARAFTAPLNRLLGGVRRVAAGELGAQVDARSRDEFGDLSAAFNDMSASLLAKQQLLEAQQAENERMLLAQMPEPVAKRYREGEKSIYGEHQNVSVAFTEIEGFDEFVAGKPAAEAFEHLNTIARGFDDASAHAGIEKVRSMGTGYVASCGLVVQRVDHARRVVGFAVAVATMVERFNHQHDARLSVRVGIHSGSVSSGLVGRSDVVYNLWGEAVNLAYRARSLNGDPGIYLTDTVKERTGNAEYQFAEAGTITSGARAVPVWRLDWNAAQVRD